MRSGASEAQDRAFLDLMAGTQGIRPMVACWLEANVYLPKVTFVDGWKADIVKTLIADALDALTPQALLDYCTRNTRTIGVVAGAGQGGPFDAGAGIFFAPGNKIGFYGSFSIGGGWNVEVSAGLQVTYIKGDETLFAGQW